MANRIIFGEKLRPHEVVGIVATISGAMIIGMSKQSDSSEHSSASPLPAVLMMMVVVLANTVRGVIVKKISISLHKPPIQTSLHFMGM